MREEAKKRRIAEEEKKKTLEYFQQLWDKILAEDAAFLKGAEKSQITEYKHKEVILGDNRDCQPFKKAKEK